MINFKCKHDVLISTASAVKVGHIHEHITWYTVVKIENVLTSIEPFAVVHNESFITEESPIAVKMLKNLPLALSVMVNNQLYYFFYILVLQKLYKNIHLQIFSTLNI